MPAKTAAHHPSESAEQRTLFRWADYSTGKWPELEFMYHIPNGGHRSKATAGRLKAEGVKRGVPDIHLPVARGGYFGMYIELKSETGRPTGEQKGWLRHLERQGYLAVVCKGFEDAAEQITAYLEKEPTVPPRSSPENQINA